MICTLRAPLLALGCLAGLLPLLCGCGEKATGQAVSGSVTLDGQPLEEGQILFTPLQEGPSANAEIKGGRYQLPKARGPGPGKYRVEIRAYKDTGKTERAEVAGSTEVVVIPIIPARYNQNSELEAEIVEGVENTFDFALQSR